MMKEKTPERTGVAAPTMVCSDCGFHISLDVTAGPGGWKTLACPSCGLVIHLCRGTVSEHRFR